jgi:hypothetical protein
MKRAERRRRPSSSKTAQRQNGDDLVDGSPEALRKAFLSPNQQEESFWSEEFDTPQPGMQRRLQRGRQGPLALLFDGAMKDAAGRFSLEQRSRRARRAHVRMRRRWCSDLFAKPDRPRINSSHD